MFCPGCSSNRLYGPHYACELKTRLRQALMDCANCGQSFDAYDFGAAVALRGTVAAA